MKKLVIEIKLFILFKNVGFAVEMTDPPHEPHKGNSNDGKYQSL